MPILGGGMASSNFFPEPKRRNGYKVAVVYAVASWLLIQAALICQPTPERGPDAFACQ
jgi:hypothetical protein